MKAQSFIEHDPARDIELPKSEDRLPTSTLTAEEMETLLNQPDVTTRLGLRDRTIMETFYSTGIRCGELIALDVYDINYERGIVTIRLGKGGKERGRFRGSKSGRSISGPIWSRSRATTRCSCQRTATASDRITCRKLSRTT